jgi:hypothetical protein
MAKVSYATNQSKDGTQVWVSTARMSNDLILYTILLVSKRQGCECGLLELFEWCCQDVKAMGRANEQLDILK